MTDPHVQLAVALDALDVAFTPGSSERFTVGGCTRCYSEADLAALDSPVHEVPEELVPLVAMEATDHWPDFPAVYRRLTPRIIRSLVMNRLHVDPGLIGTRLLEANWRSWPSAEQEALEQVWDAWWRSVLAEQPLARSGSSAAKTTETLEAISVSTGTLKPWLDIWAETRTDVADQHLRDAVDFWLIEGGIAEEHFGFYNELNATAELVPWLLTTVKNRISSGQLAEIERVTA